MTPKTGFFSQIWNMMCEDGANLVIDPLRAGFVAGLITYLVGGAALIVALLHTVWFTEKAADLQSYAIGLAAWGAGLGGILTGAGAGVMMKAKGDAA